jgi:hypothetical protein
MELLETAASYLVAAAVGAFAIWYPNRRIKRQFTLMLEAIAEGKVEGKDWRFVRDARGNPVGFRVIHSASAPTDKPGSN